MIILTLEFINCYVILTKYRLDGVYHIKLFIMGHPQRKVKLVKRRELKGVTKKMWPV